MALRTKWRAGLLDEKHLCSGRCCVHAKDNYVKDSKNGKNTAVVNINGRYNEKGSKGDEKVVICYLCGEIGHMSWQCKDASNSHTVRSEKFRRRIESELSWLLTHCEEIKMNNDSQSYLNETLSRSKAMLGRLGEDNVSMVYPRRLRGWERKIIHRECERLGLSSKSRGEGRLRRVTVFPLNSTPPAIPSNEPKKPKLTLINRPAIPYTPLAKANEAVPRSMLYGTADSSSERVIYSAEEQQHATAIIDAIRSRNYKELYAQISANGPLQNLLPPGITPLHLTALACSEVSQAPARGERKMHYMRSKEFNLMREIGNIARIDPLTKNIAQSPNQACPGVSLMGALKASGWDTGVANDDGTGRAQKYLDGILPIHCAAFSGCLSCLETEHDRVGNSYLHHQDSLGRTPLYWAIAGGSLENARYLVEHGANVSHSTMIGRTMLTKAAWCNLPEIVILLLENKADYFQRDQKGRTAMHVAVASGARAAMLALLDALGPSLPMRAQDGFGATPLHIAAGGTDPIFNGAVEFMVNQIDRRQGRGALVRELAEIRNYKGDTPLMVAVSKGSQRAVEALLGLEGKNALTEPTCFEAGVVATSIGNADALKLIAPKLDKDRIGGLVTLGAQSKQPECLKILLPLLSEPPTAGHLASCITVDDLAAVGQETWNNAKSDFASWLLKGLQCQALIIEAGSASTSRDLIIAARAIAAIKEEGLKTGPEPDWDEIHMRCVANSIAKSFEKAKEFLSGTSFQSSDRKSPSSENVIEDINEEGVEAAAVLAANEGWPEAMGAILEYLGHELSYSTLESFVTLCSQLGHSATLRHVLEFYEKIAYKVEDHTERDRISILQEAINIAAYEGNTDSVREIIRHSRKYQCKQLNLTTAYLIAEARANVRLLINLPKIANHYGIRNLEMHQIYRPLEVDWRLINTKYPEPHPDMDHIANWFESPSNEETWSVEPYTFSPGWHYLQSFPPDPTPLSFASEHHEEAEKYVKWNQNVQLVKTKTELDACIATLEAELLGPLPASQEDLGELLTDSSETQALPPRALGIDLEYAALDSRMSFGYVSLIQLGTLTSSYVIDAAVLRDHISSALSPLLRNERVVKVMHGGNTDLRWLWADFNIRVTNLFDTYQASLAIAKHMGGPASLRHGLGHIVGRFYGTPLDKRLQKADWRIRPLPAAMIDYAANDARYLPGLFVMMAKQLHSLGELRDVARRCNNMCLLTGLKPMPIVDVRCKSY